MHIYVFEPRIPLRAALTSELKDAGITAVFIEERFLASDLSVLNAKGSDTRPILISETGAAADQVRRVRACGCRNPLIVLRDTRSSQHAAEVLNAGADDVMVAPLKGIELASRIHSIVRRAYGHAAESVTVGEITAYFDGRDPEISGERLRLSKREHAIFQHLVLNANRVIAKGAIYDAVYGMSDAQPFDKVIDVYICKLRKKISEAAGSGHQYIETIGGRGYRFAAGEDAQRIA